MKKQSKCNQGTSGAGPIKSLQLHLELEASTKIRFEGTNPLVISEDPLKALQELFNKIPVVRIPIIPPFISFEFKFQPSVTMPFDLTIGIKGKGEIFLHMMGPIQTINLIGNLPQQQSGPDFSKSTVEMTGSLTAGVSLGLNIKAELFLSFVFLSFFQVGVGATVEMEAGAGADLGLSTANSECDDDEWRMQTINTHYVEYCAKDTELYNSYIKEARTKQDGMVLGIGAWYYVTFPHFKIFFFAGFPNTPGDCSVFLGHVLADSMVEGWFKNHAVIKGSDGVSGAYTDALMKKQTLDEKAGDKKWMHPLVDFDKAPFLLRDTITHAIKIDIPTSSQKQEMLKESASAKKGGQVKKMNIFNNGPMALAVAIKDGDSVSFKRGNEYLVGEDPPRVTTYADDADTLPSLVIRSVRADGKAIKNGDAVFLQIPAGTYIGVGPAVEDVAYGNSKCPPQSYCTWEKWYIYNEARSSPIVAQQKVQLRRNGRSLLCYGHERNCKAKSTCTPPGPSCWVESFTILPGYSEAPVQFKDGDVRIVTTDQVEGRLRGAVLVYYMGKWGTLCGHWFWNNNHGRNIICKQLGYELGRPMDRIAGYVDSYPVSYIGYRKCDSSNLASLQECEEKGQSDRSGSCPVSNDQFVECSMKPF